MMKTLDTGVSQFHWLTSKSIYLAFVYFSNLAPNF